jgi:hypothetical protein
VPDLVLGQLQNEGRFRLKALPEPEDELADERTLEFRAALSKARVADETYRAAIAALDQEDPSSTAKEEKIERDLRDRLRAKLALPPHPTRRSLDLNAHAARHGGSATGATRSASLQTPGCWPASARLQRQLGQESSRCSG